MNQFVVAMINGAIKFSGLSPFRFALLVCDVVLSQGGTDGRDLANVLSAVRGIDKPKDQREPIKVNSTGVIRAVAFPLTAETSKTNGLGWTVTTGTTTVKTTGNVADGHFNRHVKQAARALGLTVSRS